MARTSLNIDINARDRASPTFKNLQSSIIRFVGAVSASLAAIKGVSVPTGDAVAFERAMVDVQKTTEFTNRTIGILGDQFGELSRNVNVASLDLAKIGAAAGQLGLGRQGAEGILKFTEATARFSSVVDVAVDNAGKGLAKIANIFGISLGEAERISSAFNEVSNKTTASGEDLIDIVQRLGDAGGSLDLRQSLALAATGRDFGLTLETIGTSFTKIFAKMQADAADFAEFMGTSAEAWSRQVETDGIGALQSYLDKLRQADRATQATVITALSGGGRIFSLVNKLVQDTDNVVLLNALEAANVGFNEGTSAIKEQEKVLGTVRAQWDILKNTITDVTREIAERSLPFLLDTIKTMKSFVESNSFSGFLETVAGNVGEFVSGLQAMILRISDLDVVWSNLLQIIKIFIGFKLAQVFLRMVQGIGRFNSGLQDAVKNWRSLANGSREATTAAERAIARSAQAAQRLGSSLGVSGEGRSARDQLQQLQRRIALNRTTQAQLSQQLATIRQTAEARARATQRISDQQKAITQLYEGERRRLQSVALQRRQDLARHLGGIDQIGKKEEQRLRRQAAADARTSPLASLRQQSIQLAQIAQQEQARAQQASVLARTSAQQRDLLNQRLATMRAQTAELQRQTSVVGRLGNAAKGLGASLLGFVGGIPGIFLGIITSVVAWNVLTAENFGIMDKILGALGFQTKAQKEAAALARDQAKEQQKVAKAAEASAEAYDKMVSEAADGRLPVPGVGSGANEQNVLGSATLGDTFTQYQQLLKLLNLVEGKITDVTNKTSDQTAAAGNAQEAIIDKQLRLNELQERLLQVTDELTGLEAQAARDLTGTTALQRQNLDQEVGAIEQEQQQLIAEIAKLENSVEGADVALAALAAQQGTAAADRRNVLLALGQFVDNSQIKYLEASLAVSEFKEQLEQARQELNLLDQKQIESTAPEYRAATEQVALMQQELIKAEQNQAKFLKSAEDSSKPLTKIATSAVTATTKVEDMRNLVRQMKDAMDVSGISAGTLADSFAQIQFPRAAVIDRDFRVVSSVMTKVAVDAENAAKTARDAWRNAMADIHAQAVELEAFMGQVDFNIGEREAGVSEQEAENRLERRIQKRKEENKAYLDGLKARGASQKFIDAETKRLAESDQLWGSIEEKKRATLEQDKARERILRLQAEIEERITSAQELAGQGTEAGRVASEAELELARRAHEELQQFIAELSEDTRTYKGLIGDSLELVIPSDLIKEAAEAFRQTHDVFKAAEAEILDTIADAEEAKAAELSGLASELSTLVKEASTAMQGFRQEFEGATLAAAKISEEYRNQNPQIALMLEQFEAINTELDSTPELLKQLNVDELVKPEVVEKMLNNVNTASDEAVKVIEQKYADIVNSEGINALPRKLFGLLQEGANASREVWDSEIGKLVEKLNSLKGFTIPGQFDAVGVYEALKLEVEQLTKNDPIVFAARADVQSSTGGGSNAPAFASGGHVRGPGSGTSDSILAWLSNGEYVIDAMTTRKLGSGFFRRLQDYARRGSMPKFASGGHVGEIEYPNFDAFAPTAIPAASTVSEEITINLPIGGNLFKLKSDRETARGLTEVLQRLGA